MKLFSIEFNECDYDQYGAFVIIANDEKDAISLIKKMKEYMDEVDWEGGYKIHEIILTEYSQATIDNPYGIFASDNNFKFI